MSHITQSLSAAHTRTLGLIFAVVILLLSTFAIRAAAGVGGFGIYAVTFIQMLLLAAIVAPYVFAVIFLGGEDEH